MKRSKFLKAGVVELLASRIRSEDTTEREKWFELLSAFVPYGEPTNSLILYLFLHFDKTMYIGSF